MTASEATLNVFLRQYLKMITNDLDERHLDAIVINGFHSPRWILCHLAIAGDMGLRMLGKDRHCPKTWAVAYGPGSDGSTHPKIAPSKEELLSKISDIYTELASAVQSAPSELLEQPHSLELLKSSALQTNGHLISHLLTTHFAVHLGQLSTIRRQIGLPHLF
jgi:hypothetical protein